MGIFLDANAEPKPKPFRINDKVLISQYVIVGEVERIEYFESVKESDRRSYRRAIPAPANIENLGKQLTIRVIEAIKWDPNPDQLGWRTGRGLPKVPPVGPAQPIKRIKLVIGQYVSVELLQQCAVGHRLVFFVNPELPTRTKSDPPELFGKELVTRFPNGRVHPESLDRLPEVRKAFTKPEPYRGVEY